MVIIMYVDGDLVPQSTTKMPRENNTVKYYFKFRQKSWRQSSKDRHCQSITKSSVPMFHPINDFLKMSLSCDTSLNLSEFSAVLRKSSSLINIRQKEYKQKRQKTRKKYEKFDNFYKNTSIKSSKSNTLVSKPHEDQTGPIIHENINSFDGVLFCTKTAAREEESGALLANDLLFHPSGVLCNLISIDTGFESR